jgi:putative ABC transport system substrate-binding protein
MDRRTLICIAGSTLLLVSVTFVAKAQAPANVRRMGLLVPGARPTPPDPDLLKTFARLRELGWAEGQNLLVEQRWAGGRAELLRPFAEELVRLNVELIVTIGTDAAVAAKKATTKIPIIMFSAGDPVGAGLVASLAQPGGNVTGYSVVAPELDAKRLALLHELLPDAKRIGVLVNPNNPIFSVLRKEIESNYQSLGIQSIFVDVASANELEDAVAEIARQRGQAIVVGADGIFSTNQVAIMRAALRYALPTIGDDESMLEAGGLIYYGASAPEGTRRVAAFIDKILRGAKPADLPVEQPTKFELGINLKTAKALGITIPQSLLLRADNVIQ